MTTPQASEPTATKPPAKKPPKGILKKPKAELDNSIVVRAKAAQTALQHAKILQDRKRFESHILDCIIKLSELPDARGPPYSAANPSESDAAEFKSLVRVFQPSDFDDLVEERNVTGLCGYALCGKPRVRYKGGQWKIHNNAIVKKAELEKWCSEDCARRAMYVKVQLNETAAWERVGIPTIQIDLMGERAKTGKEELQDEMARLELDDKRRAVHESNALAAERECSKKPFDTHFDIPIREKAVTAPAEAPFLQDQDGENDVHMMVEGHRVKLLGKLHQETSRTHESK